MITKTDQSLSNVFDVAPSTASSTSYDIIEHDDQEPAKPTKSLKPTNEKQDADFEIARKTIHNLLLHGQTTLKNAILVANGSEDPESFNAVSSLISKITVASTKLLELHEIKQKIEPKSGAAAVAGQAVLPGLSTTNNISGPIFCGTTTEFSKLCQGLVKN